MRFLTPSSHIYSSRLSITIVLLLNFAAIITAWTGSLTQTEGNALRIIVGGLAVTLFPGVLLGHFFKTRATSIFEAIAKGLGLSLLFITPTAFVAMLFGANIYEWISFLLFFNAALSLFLLIRPSKASFYPTLTNALVLGIFRPKHPEAGFLLFAIILLSVSMYRWGDDITGVDWEVSLHLAYIRQFASGLPMGFSEVALRPEIGPANLFFLLWEFILASISAVSGVDPLVGTLRSRWLIPFLGFSTFYFFLRQVLATSKMTNAAMWVVLVLILSGFLAIAPSPLVNHRIIAGDFRPIFSFLGSIHHSDAALDILLPLLSGYLFLYLRKGGKIDLLLFCALLLIGFLFHVREYFQVMWYGVIAALAYLLYQRPHWSFFISRFGRLATAFIIIAAVLVLLSVLFTPNYEQLNDVNNKISYFWRILNQGKFFYSEPFFNFQMHGSHWGAPTPPNMYSWLVLTGLVFPAVIFSRSRTNMHFTGLVMVLWWVTMCFSVTQYILVLLTYNEIVLSKVRFLPLFAYGLIAVGWFETVRLFQYALERSNFSLIRSFRPLLIVFAYFIFGLVFAALWFAMAPNFVVLPHILGFVVGTSWLAIFLILRRPDIAERFRISRMRRALSAIPTPSTVLAVLCLAVFILPVSAKDASSFIHKLIYYRSNVQSLFEDGNPTGLGKETIRFLRSEIPLRSRILVDPLSNHMLGTFAAQYSIPVMKGQVAFDGHHISEAREDRHPLFNSRLKTDAPDIEGVLSYIKQTNADYILAPVTFSPGIDVLLERLPQVFSRIHEDPTTGDQLIAIHSGQSK
jgi:hypothetical protein